MRLKLECPFTNKKINLGTYIKLHNKFFLSKKEFKFKILHHNFGDIVTFEKFKELYSEKMYSLPDFKKEYNLDYGHTLWLIDYHGIKKRSLKDSVNTDKKHQKYKDTCLKKYGVENVSQMEHTKEKKKQTFLKNYGVDNIRKCPSFCAWLDSYMFEKYGKKRITGDPNKISERSKEMWALLSPEDRNKKIQKQVECLKNAYLNLSEDSKNLKIKKWHDGWENWRNSLTLDQKEEISEKRRLSNQKYWSSLSLEKQQEKISNLLSGKYSKLELTFQNYLNILGIEYQHAFYIGKNQFDYKLINTNILIEINGDFWHANPNIYKPDDLLKHPRTTGVKAKDIWEKDFKKSELAKNKGYKVIIFWESFLRNSSEEQILEKLYNEIKIGKEDTK